MTREELLEASGAGRELLEDLESFGVITARGGKGLYDAEAVTVETFTFMSGRDVRQPVCRLDRKLFEDLHCLPL